MSKKLNNSKRLINKNEIYSPIVAINLLKKTAKAKFKESVEVHIRLSSKYNSKNQVVRNTVILPYGTGRIKRIAVITKNKIIAEKAKLSGANIVGHDNLIKDISNYQIDFDILIVEHDSIKDLKNVAKILGPKGLMPNIKSGTISSDIETTIKEFKNGKIEYKSDSFGIIHTSIGNVSFAEKEIINNLKVLMSSIIKTKPINFKGQYINTVSVSSTMGPGIFIDYKSL
ncbi:MAG: 50S ribosomal protein L1 [Endomicrobium sp.]|jgi:large subunit ribosomal protein L1|nr:50S ribosomal protein L1 [Endomicrobium sp.]